jgi:hypothetical protein
MMGDNLLTFIANLHQQPFVSPFQKWNLPCSMRLCDAWLTRFGGPLFPVETKGSSTRMRYQLSRSALADTMTLVVRRGDFGDLIRAQAWFNVNALVGIVEFILAAHIFSFTNQDHEHYLV